MGNPAAAQLLKRFRSGGRTALGLLLLGTCLSAGLRAGDAKALAPANCSTEAAARRQPACQNVVFHGSRARQDIAITFDACPRKHVEGFSKEIVNYLKQEKIPTTFFVSGRWAESCPDCFRMLQSEPFFEIGLHGYAHKWPAGLSEEELATEIEKNQKALKVLGSDPQPLFRPPFGDNPVELVEVARRLGVTPILWDVAPDDPDPHRTPEILEKYVVSQAKGGSIVVMHVNGGGVWTAKALPEIVEQLREKGFTFVKVSDLLRH